MATVNQGSSATAVLVAGDYISLKNGANDAARIEFAAPAGREVQKINHAGRGVYGPFSRAGNYKISAIVGQVVYLSGSISVVTPLGRAS